MDAQYLRLAERIVVGVRLRGIGGRLRWMLDVLPSKFIVTNLYWTRTPGRDGRRHLPEGGPIRMPLAGDDTALLVADECVAERRLGAIHTGRLDSVGITGVNLVVCAKDRP